MQVDSALALAALIDLGGRSNTFLYAVRIPRDCAATARPRTGQRDCTSATAHSVLAETPCSMHRTKPSDGRMAPTTRSFHSTACHRIAPMPRGSRDPVRRGQNALGQNPSPPHGAISRRRSIQVYGSYAVRQRPSSSTRNASRHTSPAWLEDPNASGSTHSVILRSRVCRGFVRALAPKDCPQIAPGRVTRLASHDLGWQSGARTKPQHTLILCRQIEDPAQLGRGRIGPKTGLAMLEAMTVFEIPDDYRHTTSRAD